ncbi:unnamed protein product [Calypogeia fissa]
MDVDLSMGKSIMRPCGQKPSNSRGFNILDLGDIAHEDACVNCPFSLIFPSRAHLLLWNCLHEVLTDGFNCA